MSDSVKAKRNHARAKIRQDLVFRNLALICSETLYILGITDLEEKSRENITKIIAARSRTGLAHDSRASCIRRVVLILRKLTSKSGEPACEVFGQRKHNSALVALFAVVRAFIFSITCLITVVI